MFLVVIRSSTADLLVATVGISTTISCSTAVVKASFWLRLILLRTNHVVMLLERWVSVLSCGVSILPGILIRHHHPWWYIFNHLYRTAHARKDTAAIGKSADLLERHAKGIQRSKIELWWLYIDLIKGDDMRARTTLVERWLHWLFGANLPCDGRTALDSQMTWYELHAFDLDAILLLLWLLNWRFRTLHS